MGVESINKNMIRYSQCWEDCDTLLEHMRVRPGQTVLSIASAGDNTLSLLSTGAGKVIAVDLSAAQLALLELKAACFKWLSHSEMMYFLGAPTAKDFKPAESRISIYTRLRVHLSPSAQQYFDHNRQAIARGVIDQGKMERYFSLFRRFILPLVQSRSTVDELLQAKPRNHRADFYRKKWGTFLYVLLFKMFFSRFFMGLLGREKCFFAYADESLSLNLLQASKAALIEQEPAHNPYLRWILTGDYGPVLPHYLRPENFAAIRDNLRALELRQGNLNEIMADLPGGSVDSFNLSDVFEYLSPDKCRTLAELIVTAAKADGRMVYWNMLVDRKAANFCPQHLQIEEDYSTSLAAITKTFFYKRLLVERVCK